MSVFLVKFVVDYFTFEGPLRIRSVLANSAPEAHRKLIDEMLPRLAMAHPQRSWSRGDIGVYDTEKINKPGG